jgi:hypothetical protein
MCPAYLWDFMWRRLVFHYRRFGISCGSISKCQAVRRLDVCSVEWDVGLKCYIGKVSVSGLATLPE